MLRLKSVVKFNTKFGELCLTSLVHVEPGRMVYFGFIHRSKSETKFESSVSLRSAMWFILRLISKVKFKTKFVVYLGFENIRFDSVRQNRVFFSHITYCLFVYGYVCNER